MTTQRRNWSEQDKTTILKEWDEAKTGAERMALLQRFNVYRSVVDNWRRKRAAALTNGHAPQAKAKSKTRKSRVAARPARKVVPPTALAIPRNGDAEVTESAAHLEVENRALKGLLQLAVHRGFLSSLLDV